MKLFSLNTTQPQFLSLHPSPTFPLPLDPLPEEETFKVLLFIHILPTLNLKVQGRWASLLGFKYR